MVPVGDRPLARLDDMCRRRKIGLADAQIDDRLPPGREALRLGQDFEGGLGPEPVHTRRNFEHYQTTFLPAIAWAGGARSRSNFVAYRDKPARAS
jgi:hypothetical protein